MIMNRKAYAQIFTIALISMLLMAMLLAIMRLAGFEKQANEPDYRQVLVTKDGQTKKYKNVWTVQKNSHIFNDNTDYKIILKNGKEIIVRNPQAIKTTLWE